MQETQTPHPHPSPTGGAENRKKFPPTHPASAALVLKATSGCEISGPLLVFLRHLDLEEATHATETRSGGVGRWSLAGRRSGPVSEPVHDGGAEQPGPGGSQPSRGDAVADQPCRAVQQRRRLLPARGRGPGQRPYRPVLPRPGHQRPIKSMVLQDPGGGNVSAVSYDSQAPVDKTLRILRHQPDQQPHLRPDSEPGPRRKGRSRVAAERRRPARHAHRHRHGPREEEAGRRQGHRRESSSSISGAPKACVASGCRMSSACVSSTR